nr:methylated-DNA--[protein]-cysteine S-methyltransferase [Oceaniglobus ichthyenteri]
MVAQGERLIALRWGGRGNDRTPLLTRAADQLAAYFAGALTQFDLPLQLASGVLQSQVQRAIQAIPYGETRTYGDLAQALNTPAQAIGQACGANALTIIIPCHRVLGATGLGGYSGAGGIETKVALLRLEGAAGLLI